MVEQFVLRLRNPDGSLIDGRKLTKQIRDRCDTCYVPECWTLKDPRDKGQIHLSKKYLTTGKWRKVQIRQLLFQIAYGEAPPIGRTIWMYCKNKKCCNPAHMKVAGWRPPWDAVHTLIHNDWLTEEQAVQWHISNRKPLTEPLAAP